MTTIVTLAMDEASQKRFDRLREEHYPAELDKIAAHLTLFHTLPGSVAVRAGLVKVTGQSGFAMRVSEVMSLGRGVALRVESAGLLALHKRLAAAFADELSAQDKQGFRPHVVVQNKVSGEAARELLRTMRGDFVPWEITAVGLDWWDYLGGPWKLRERFAFTE